MKAFWILWILVLIAFVSCSIFLMVIAATCITPPQLRAVCIAIGCIWLAVGMGMAAVAVKMLIVDRLKK